MEAGKAIHAACKQLAGKLMGPVLTDICNDEKWEENR